MDNKLKHLEFIQTVIGRMTTNSFWLKGWSVTLTVALFAFVAKDLVNAQFIIVAYFPLAFFWTLDGYFLYQERLFRTLYNQVRKTRDEQIDFSMDTKKFDSGIKAWIQSTFSCTLLMFYIPLLAIILLAIYLLNC